MISQQIHLASRPVAMAGLTGWVGLFKVAQLKPTDTVFVSIERRLNCRIYISEISGLLRVTSTRGKLIMTEQIRYLAKELTLMSLVSTLHFS